MPGSFAVIDSSCASWSPSKTAVSQTILGSGLFGHASRAWSSLRRTDTVIQKGSPPAVIR
ncbi:hypothetical protein ACFWEO_04900 [Streptomyces roseolus]|uniref:hypothetical protein n=1 Tax=Streptomyces roseolus TaxID=67358 RepID=UPI003625349B